MGLSYRVFPRDLKFDPSSSSLLSLQVLEGSFKLRDTRIYALQMRARLLNPARFASRYPKLQTRGPQDDVKKRVQG